MHACSKPFHLPFSTQEYNWVPTLAGEQRVIMEDGAMNWHLMGE